VDKKKSEKLFLKRDRGKIKIGGDFKNLILARKKKYD